MTWGQQATIHYLSQCWPRFLSPNGVNSPHCVKRLQVLSPEVLWNLDIMRQIVQHLRFILDKTLVFTLHWRHNEHDGVSNHQPHDCLLNRLFGRRSKKISKLRVTGLCAGNSPGTDEFPAQMASNAENVSIWWRHHEHVSAALWLCKPLKNPHRCSPTLYVNVIILFKINNSILCKRVQNSLWVQAFWKLLANLGSAGSINGLAPKRCQQYTLANDDPDLRRHIASLCSIELNLRKKWYGSLYWWWNQKYELFGI